MAEDSPQSKSLPKTNPSPVSPQPPQPGQDNKKIGTLVERLRSFESDMARLKGVALAPAAPEPKVIPEIKLVKKNPLDIAGKPEPHIETEIHAAQSLQATNTVVSDVIHEDPKKAVAELHKEVPIQTFRTIQTDVQDASKDQKKTVAQMVAASAPLQRQVVIEDPKRSAYLLAMSGVLVIGGLIALGAYYLINHQPSAPLPVITQAHTVVDTQGTKEIIVDDKHPLMAEIIKARSEPVGIAGQIIELRVKENGKTVDAQRLASLLSNTIPTWLVRTFDTESYLNGLYAVNNSWQPVFIFKVSSYDSGYSGMLKWEETIGDDLKPLLASKPIAAPTQNSNTTASSTVSTSANPIIPTSFKDALIRNKDVRVLEDNSGRRLILYSFADQNTLVITTSEQALSEVFARLTTSQFVR